MTLFSAPAEGHCLYVCSSLDTAEIRERELKKAGYTTTLIRSVQRYGITIRWEVYGSMRKFREKKQREKVKPTEKDLWAIENESTQL